MMNRDIKFRAWVRNYMVDVARIDFIDRYITWDDNQYDRCIPPNKCYETESFEEIDLMQYTGFNDNNGKEIYEGDIVKTKNFKHFNEGDLKEVWLVVRNNGFYIENKKFGWHLHDMAINEDWEIIGNVFKNPELLK